MSFRETEGAAVRRITHDVMTNYRLCTDKKCRHFKTADFYTSIGKILRTYSGDNQTIGGARGTSCTVVVLRDISSLRLS